MIYLVISLTLLVQYLVLKKQDVLVKKAVTRSWCV